jgi:acetyl-CoA acyltransferase 2
MKRHLERIFFLSARRTPFGTYLGSLRNLSATKLGVYASKAALETASISPKLIDHVVFGNVMQTAKDAIYLARHVGLYCEVPHEVPALTVNRLCGSGFEAILQGAWLIASGKKAVLVGGSENMSQAPHIIRGARTGFSLGQGHLEDSLWECLTDSYVNLSMALTAENLAVRYGITQNEVDEYSLLSQTRYQAALKEGLFADEIGSIEITSKAGPLQISHDEHPRPDTTLDKLKNLPKVFKKDGVIHAGAASGISDGAAALIMASEEFIKEKKLSPIGELVGFNVAGCDPALMGLGPVFAIRNALNEAKLSINDMDLIEVNEAFAPQVLAVMKELNLPQNRLNVHGGAIAVGHPLAASGARIAAHLLHSLRRNKLKFGLGSACIGGGQGIAVILRSCH